MTFLFEQSIGIKFKQLRKLNGVKGARITYDEKCSRKNGAKPHNRDYKGNCFVFIFVYLFNEINLI
jgi:hypothetical protein